MRVPERAVELVDWPGVADRRPTGDLKQPGQREPRAYGILVVLVGEGRQEAQAVEDIAEEAPHPAARREELQGNDLPGGNRAALRRDAARPIDLPGEAPAAVDLDLELGAVLTPLGVLHVGLYAVTRIVPSRAQGAADTPQ